MTGPTGPIALEALSPKYDAIIIGGGHNGLVAAAYLAASEPADAASRYRRRLALAFFLQAFGEGREIRLPGLSWEKERLEELAGRARAWLDEPVAALSPLQVLDDSPTGPTSAPAMRSCRRQSP